MLTIIRGLPGSGKSTLAKSLNKAWSKVHVEADKYFMIDGAYVYDASKIKEAHAWCRDTVEEALKNGDDVIVSNTFVKKWEIDPYVDLAKTYKHDYEIIVCTGKYESIHGVPQEVIERMRSNWEEVQY